MRDHKQTIDFLADYFEKQGFIVAEKNYRGGEGSDVQLVTDKDKDNNIYYNIEVKAGKFSTTKIQCGLGQALLNGFYHTKQSFLAVPIEWKSKIHNIIYLARKLDFGLILVKENNIEIIGGELIPPVKNRRKPTPMSDAGL